MKLRRLLCILGLFAVLLTSSACFRPWQLIRKAMPRPYPPNARFVIMPISYRSVNIDNMSRAEYLSRKNPTDRGKWKIILTSMRHLFADNVINHAGNALIRKGFRRRKNELAIFAIAEDIQVGFYGGLINRLSRVQMRVQIRAGRRVFDEFVVVSSTAPNDGLLPRFPSVASRMRRDAIKLGRNAAAYINHRLQEP